MKSLLAILLLSTSLSAFAFPEDYYLDAPMHQAHRGENEVKNVVVIVEGLNIEATAANAVKICKAQDLTTAVEFTASINENSETSTLLNVVCR